MGWSADWVPCVWYFGWFLFLGIIVYPVFFVWIVKPSLSSSLKSSFISLLLCCFGMLCFSFLGRLFVWVWLLCVVLGIEFYGVVCFFLLFLVFLVTVCGFF